VFVEGLSSTFTEVRRFPNVRFQQHPSDGAVIATAFVDSSKDSCLSLDGVVRLLKQPTTFNAVYVHVATPLSLEGTKYVTYVKIFGGNGEDWEFLFCTPTESSVHLN
jgi:hypothetical protein